MAVTVPSSGVPDMRKVVIRRLADDFRVMADVFDEVSQNDSSQKELTYLKTEMVGRLDRIIELSSKQ